MPRMIDRRSSMYEECSKMCGVVADGCMAYGDEQARQILAAWEYLRAHFGGTSAELGKGKRDPDRTGPCGTDDAYGAFLDASIGALSGALRSRGVLGGGERAVTHVLDEVSGPEPELSVMVRRGNGHLWRVPITTHCPRRAGRGARSLFSGRYMLIGSDRRRGIPKDFADEVLEPALQMYSDWYLARGDSGGRPRRKLPVPKSAVELVGHCPSPYDDDVFCIYYQCEYGVGCEYRHRNRFCDRLYEPPVLVSPPQGLAAQPRRMRCLFDLLRRIDHCGRVREEKGRQLLCPDPELDACCVLLGVGREELAARCLQRIRADLVDARQVGVGLVASQGS
jgi:hypothetical protein